MDEISSTEFRKRYPDLKRPTIVRAGKHVIGEWWPAGSEPDDGPRVNMTDYSGLNALARSRAREDAAFDRSKSVIEAWSRSRPAPKVRKP